MKKFRKLILEILIETLNQTWTLLGMFVAWCVLEGSARTVVGFAIVWSLVIWLITIRLRVTDVQNNDKDEK